MRRRWRPSWPPPRAYSDDPYIEDSVPAIASRIPPRAARADISFELPPVVFTRSF